MRPGASAAVTLEGEDLAFAITPDQKSRFGGIIPAVAVASLSAVLMVLVISAFGIIDWRFWEDSQSHGFSAIAGPSTPQNPPVFIYSPNFIDTPEVVRVLLSTSAPTGAAELVITSLGDKSPVSTAPPVVSTLEFIEIALSGIEKSEVDGAEIEFGIDATRRAVAGDRRAVVAYRYVDDWVPLPTTFVRADGPAEIYSAITPGFSYFAITVANSSSGDAIADSSPTPEVEPQVEANPTASPVAVTPTATPDSKIESVISPTATTSRPMTELSGNLVSSERTPTPTAQVLGRPTITDLTVGDRFAVSTPVASSPEVPIAVTSLQSMAQAREGASATLLADGRLLVLGGTAPDGQYLNSGEIFDPETGRWSTITPMFEARANHTATLVHDGRVLVAGGVGPGGILASVQVYDTFRDRWESDALMISPRSQHTDLPQIVVPVAMLVPDARFVA